jgi:hypothetical protein
MNTSVGWVSEPQELQLVAQGVRSRVTAFTKAVRVRLERLEEAATERLRRLWKQVPLIRERGACTDHSGP